MTRQLSRLRTLPAGRAYPFSVTVGQMGDAVWVMAPAELYQMFQTTLRGRLAPRPVIRRGKPPALPGDSSSLTIPGNLSAIETKVAPFPLTPALSPDPLRRRDLPRRCASTAGSATGSAAREREKDVSRWGGSVLVGFANSRSRIFPLLGGE